MIITDSTPDFILAESQIDIWQFSLANNLSRSPEILNDDELTRARRFYFERHQRRFATARTCMREILAIYLHVNPNSLNFSYNQQGKPYINSQENIQFNLSHSGDIALLAVGELFPLGVDLEHYSARPYEDIAKNFFSLPEQKALKNSPNWAKPATFFNIWSQKEAFIKACGLGLSYPTEQFTVSIKSRYTEVWDDMHKKSWQLMSFMPNIAVSAALCCEPSIKTIRKFTWHP